MMYLADVKLLLLLELLLVFFQELLVLLLNHQLLQRLGVLGQGGRLCASEGPMLPELMDGMGLQGHATQAWGHNTWALGYSRF